jgi:2-polyprenyl-3-methyl-5-hydroxy-6-metoxy-1,4-benzoquinol methylase
MLGSDVCILDATHPPAKPLFKFRDFQITQCGGCGLIMSASAVEEEAREDESYYTLAHTAAAAVYFEWGFRWRWILGEIAKFKSPGTALDVGAGNGLFVKIAAEEYHWKSRGLELSRQAITFAKTVLDVDLEPRMLNEVPDRFDLVTCFNLLEHLVDPLALIGEMRERLNPGGLIALTTPSPACIHARIKGLQKWGMVAPPHHVNIFTRRALEVALAKSGFELLKYDTISTYISFLRRIEKRGSVLRRLAFEALRLTGLGADHLVIARKL